MKIEKITEFPSPILVLDEFFSKEDADRCLRECISLKPIFMPASVGAGSYNRMDPKIRSNDAVMMDTVFSVAPDRSAILSSTRKRIGESDCKKLWHEGDLIFDIVNYATWRETVLSRYGNRDFYERHQDTIYNKEHPSEITRRLVTLVIYLNAEPRSFSGGDLVLYKEGKEITIPAHHNRAIMFPSFTFHRVTNVEMATGTPWENGRFSINHWLGFR